MTWANKMKGRKQLASETDHAHTWTIQQSQMHTPAVITTCRALNTPFDVMTLTGLPGWICSTLWCSSRVPPHLTNNSYVSMSKKVLHHMVVLLQGSSCDATCHVKIVIGHIWCTAKQYYQWSKYCVTISCLKHSDCDRDVYFHRSPSILCIWARTTSWANGKEWIPCCYIVGRSHWKHTNE